MKKLDYFVPYSTQSIDHTDKQAILDTLDSAFLTQGHRTLEFESVISRVCGSKFALSFNSATSALYATFYAIRHIYCGGSHPYQKKILTTPISFVATTNSMVLNGFLPVFGDIDMDGNINVDSLENLVDEDTIALCSVDYAGKSVDVCKCADFVKRYNLVWVSDSSHSFGAKVKVGAEFRSVGSFADVSIFSFHALKTITTCEGGAIATDNEDIFNVASLVRSHGIQRQQVCHSDCHIAGFNFRMSEVGAALGISQAKRINDFIARREEISTYYDDVFRYSPYFSTNHIDGRFVSTRHLYPLMIHRRFFACKDSIIMDLLDLNVGVQVHYRPIYSFSFYVDLLGRVEYSQSRVNAELFYSAELSIPNHQGISPDLARKISQIIFFVFDKYDRMIKT